MQPLPPTDESVPDGDSPTSLGLSASPRPGSKWRTFRWVLFWILIAIVVLFFLAAPRGHGHGRRTLLVTGRLVADDTAAPIEGARVLVVSSRDLERPWDPEEAWESLRFPNPYWPEWVNPGEERERPGSDDRRDCDGTRSGTGGLVEFETVLLSTTTLRSFWWSTYEQLPEDAVAALWIEPEGREPVVVHLGKGRLQQHGDGEDHPIWGTYDLGTVAVPVGVEQDGG